MTKGIWQQDIEANKRVYFVSFQLFCFVFAKSWTMIEINVFVNVLNLYTEELEKLEED